MIVTKYEIDMINVGAADAFCIHFYNDEDDQDYIILIDGGNYDDGHKIADFIQKNYHKTKIDLVICSHCDKDHFGGILYLLEQQLNKGKDNMNIKQICVNDPAKHVPNGLIKWSDLMNYQTQQVKARSVYDIDGHDNMLDLIESLGILWYEPFSDADTFNEVSYYENGLIKILGPSREYYKSLVPEFRNELQKKQNGYDSDETDSQEAELRQGRIIYSKTLDEADDDPSSHNKSSVIFLFQPDDGKKFLFMGDACRDSINNMTQMNINLIRNVDWLKVPHHGSKHNLDNDMINHIHPDVAFISTESYGHYLSKAVVNALKKSGTRVFSTNVNGSMCHHKNTRTHIGYTPATPL